MLDSLSHYLHPYPFLLISNYSTNIPMTFLIEFVKPIPYGLDKSKIYLT